jgi:hypothetical protein
MDQSLDVLEPAGSSVQYHGERLDIRPLVIGQLPRLVRAARPVIDAVLALEELPDENSGEMVTLLLDLIEKHDRQVFEAAAICTGKTAEWMEGGQLDEFVILCKTVFEVNRDFFARKLAPLLGGRAGSIAGSLGGGKTPSSSSSSTGTASRTSADTPSDSSAPSATPAPASATGS